MIDGIVVGTDGSSRAAEAVRWSAELAKKLDAELLVVHVFETDPVKLPGGYVVLPEDQLNQLRDTTREKLETEWSTLAREAGTRWRAQLLEGNAPAALMDFGEWEKAGLIVVGSRGRGGFAGLLFGSVSQHLVQHLRIPILVVPSR